MRRLAVVMLSVLAAAAAGCADDYGGSVGYGASYYGPGYYGPGDVYYDGFYGPYPGGYWGDGGIFFYSDGHGRHHRDDGHHFRHQPFPHSEHFQMGGQMNGRGHDFHRH